MKVKVVDEGERDGRLLQHSVELLFNQIFRYYDFNASGPPLRSQQSDYKPGWIQATQ